MRVDTWIDISASRERVWEVLSDLASYPDWNPMIRHATGELKPGRRLTLHFQPEGSRRRRFRPRLIVVDEPGELRWLGSPRLPGLVDSEHYFILGENPGGSTRLQHGTVFYGLLAPFLERWVEGSTRVPFESMNSALRSRAEKDEAGGVSGTRARIRD